MSAQNAQKKKQTPTFVLCLENEGFQKQITQLCQNLSTIPYIVPDKNDFSDVLKTLKNQKKNKNEIGKNHVLFICDNIDFSQNKSLTQLESEYSVTTMLLLDEQGVKKVQDNDALFFFPHVIPCENNQVPRLLIATTYKKISSGKYFGVKGCLADAVHIHRYSLSHSDQREWFRDVLYEFVLGLSAVFERPTDSFSQFSTEVQEELLMNAIWDANPKLKSVDRRLPIELLPEEAVQIEWGFDGTHLAIGVRDFFGTLPADVIKKYLKFIFAKDRLKMVKMGQETSGSGLGLFMVIERISSITVNVLPGKSTEVIATLNLKLSPKVFSKLQKSFQFFDLT